MQLLHVLAVLSTTAAFQPVSPTLQRQRTIVNAGAPPPAFDLKATLTGVQTKMDKSVQAMRDNFLTIRTGRASPDILNRVTVDYYGAETPLKQLASITVSTGTQLLVSPFDKGVLKAIDAAIFEANLGMTPNNDGSVIRLNVPALTEERRKEIIKGAKVIAEEAKVAVRNIRRSAIEDVKKLEKKKEIGEDVVKDAEQQVQKITDAVVKTIDGVLEAKQKEIMKV
ncbi:ribosome recycling factor [Pelagophyceae sp. CCMP2097]|nr:ribosome recycling factor [Pelagophyceae sp. CCMP2097]